MFFHVDVYYIHGLPVVVIISAPHKLLDMQLGRHAQNFNTYRNVGIDVMTYLWKKWDGTGTGMVFIM